MTEYQQAQYYFAEHNDTGKIFPEIGPTTVPGTDDEWTSSNKKCLGGEDAYGNYTPGNVRTYVGGGGVGAQTMQLEFTWMSNAKIASLITLRDKLEQFVFANIVYSDDPTPTVVTSTKLLCIWEGGNPIALKGIPGCKTGYGVTVSLRVQGTYA